MKALSRWIIFELLADEGFIVEIRALNEKDGEGNSLVHVEIRMAREKVRPPEEKVRRAEEIHSRYRVTKPSNIGVVLQQMYVEFANEATASKGAA